MCNFMGYFLVCSYELAQFQRIRLASYSPTEKKALTIRFHAANNKRKRLSNSLTVNIKPISLHNDEMKYER